MPKFNPGDRVLVMAGVFQGFVGTVTKRQPMWVEVRLDGWTESKDFNASELQETNR